MAYCTQSDIEGQFGVSNVARWSNLESPTGPINTTRVTAAIAYAEEQINALFRDSMYAVPFSSGLTTVTWWASVIAGDWLYKSRGVREGSVQQGTSDGGDRVSRMKKMVESDMRAYLVGAKRMDTSRKPHSATSPGLGGACD